MKASSALTTKMNYGNSNTCHPIFNRTWTPAEAFALFGIGYILDDSNNYVKAKKYYIPEWNGGLTGLRNQIFEITGEAFIIKRLCFTNSKKILMNKSSY